ncbi:hypothetical protein BKN38_04860 [Helicobacter sp. CLO-3]|nr:hypothetical protein BA723_07540 [Helicobacter sp. CLO-3]OHU83919.1 hypothetical protein BKN38_04860 [Helicobacter sp. CLO-3]
MDWRGLLELSVLYGFMLLIWTLIRPGYRACHKKDFLKWWNICSVLYWILIIIAWKIYEILGIYPFFDWLSLCIGPCVVSNIYFMVFRFFSSMVSRFFSNIVFRFFSDQKTSQKPGQKPNTKYLSKNEKIEVVIASFIHFF